MQKSWMILAALGFTQVVVAQTADDYRGGWRTDSGEPHTYQFSIRGNEVRGIYCTLCSDGTTLAFLDGQFDANGITFVVTRVNADGSTVSQDRATAKFDKGTLTVAGNGPAGRFLRVLIKDPRGPDPLPLPVSRLPPAPPIPAQPRPPGNQEPYVQPGPWKAQLTEKDIIGVWLGFGVGMDKQFFIIRKIGDKLRGMVCGRCDNPYTMAALDDFRIDGDTLTFNILHEDWGPGSLPFMNQASVHIAQNEMRLVAQQDNMPPPVPRPGRIPGASLMGPISIEATKGNH